MSELKPCPFCGVKFEIWDDGRRKWALAKHRPECFFPNMHNHEIPEYDFDAWNTRAERTCEFKHKRSGDNSYEFVCSECFEHFWFHDIRPSKCHVRYCPNCGARVDH